MQRVNFYVDGLNLYFGMLKANPAVRWLDLRSLAKSLLPDGYELNRVRYFTARVSGKAGDHTAPGRQDRYLRALEVHGGVDLHFGHFTVGPDRMALDDGMGTIVTVIRIQEKCTDVNMATHILLDVLNKECDVVALITNDADPRVLVKALQVEPFNLEVWVYNPYRDQNKRLEPTRHLNLRLGSLQQNLLPSPVRTATGKEIQRPGTWR